MKFFKFIKSKGFIIYFTIGLVVYIIPYLFGITNFVRHYLEDKTMFSEYIDKIEQVYINNDKDIAMCVTGNTRGKENIEYWIYIPYRHYAYSENNFGDKLVNLSSVPEELNSISNCSTNPWIDKLFLIYKIKNNNLNFDKYLSYNEIFDYKDFIVNTENLFLVKHIDNGRVESKLVLVQLLDSGDRVGTSFNLSRRHYSELLNPLWKLIYIPAFLLDVLLWPMYLVLILSTPMKA